MAQGVAELRRGGVKAMRGAMVGGLGREWDYGMDAYLDGILVMLEQEYGHHDG